MNIYKILTSVITCVIASPVKRSPYIRIGFRTLGTLDPYLSTVKIRPVTFHAMITPGVKDI